MDNETSTWQVTSQIPATMPGPAGRFVKGVTITFVTGKGFSGEVFVPDTAYNTDNVRALLAAQAQKVDDIGTLSG
jgi:hypothetical protein